MWYSSWKTRHALDRNMSASSFPCRVFPHCTNRCIADCPLYPSRRFWSRRDRPSPPLISSTKYWEDVRHGTMRSRCPTRTKIQKSNHHRTSMTLRQQIPKPMHKLAMSSFTPSRVHDFGPSFSSGILYLKSLPCPRCSRSLSRR